MNTALGGEEFVSLLNCVHFTFYWRRRPKRVRCRSSLTNVFDYSALSDKDVGSPGFFGAPQYLFGRLWVLGFSEDAAIHERRQVTIVKDALDIFSPFRCDRRSRGNVMFPGPSRRTLDRNSLRRRRTRNFFFKLHDQTRWERRLARGFRRQQGNQLRDGRSFQGRLVVAVAVHVASRVRIGVVVRNATVVFLGSLESNGSVEQAVSKQSTERGNNRGGDFSVGREKFARLAIEAPLFHELETQAVVEVLDSRLVESIVVPVLPKGSIKVGRKTVELRLRRVALFVGAWKLNRDFFHRCKRRWT